MEYQKYSTSHNFADRLIQAIKAKNSRVVVGLDPRLNQIPNYLCEIFKKKYGVNALAASELLFEFNKQIIDAIADYAIAVKPQVAFYEQFGEKGIWALSETIKYAHSNDLLVIADGKRNDIGSTAQAYANAYLGEVELWEDYNIKMFDVDAITVNPYLGYDGIKPFIDLALNRGKGIFILVRTSNPGSGDVQSLRIDEEFLFEKVAHLVNKWGIGSEGERGYRSIGAVVGATYPIEAAKLRKIMPNSVFLVPGFGAQGATADDVKSCFNVDGFGAIINSSRDIIFSYLNEPEKSKFSEKEFALAAASATKRMQEQIERVITNTRM